MIISWYSNKWKESILGPNDWGEKNVFRKLHSYLNHTAAIRFFYFSYYVRKYIVVVTNHQKRLCSIAAKAAEKNWMVLDFLREIFMKFFKVFKEFFFNLHGGVCFLEARSHIPKKCFFLIKMKMICNITIYIIIWWLMVLWTIVFCLVKWRKIWIFHEFYFYLFLPQKEELDFCYHDLLFYVNAIAYSVLKMSCF